MQTCSQLKIVQSRGQVPASEMLISRWSVRFSVLQMFYKHRKSLFFPSDRFSLIWSVSSRSILSALKLFEMTSLKPFLSVYLGRFPRCNSVKKKMLRLPNILSPAQLMWLRMRNFSVFNAIAHWKRTVSGIRDCHLMLWFHQWQVSWNLSKTLMWQRYIVQVSKENKRAVNTHTNIYIYIYIKEPKTLIYLPYHKGHWCEMDTVIRVQILDEAVCISHSANILGNDMNPTILPPVMQ